MTSGEDADLHYAIVEMREVISSLKNELKKVKASDVDYFSYGIDKHYYLSDQDKAQRIQWNKKMSGGMELDSRGIFYAPKAGLYSFSVLLKGNQLNDEVVQLYFQKNNVSSES